MMEIKIFDDFFRGKRVHIPNSAGFLLKENGEIIYGENKSAPMEGIVISYKEVHPYGYMYEILCLSGKYAKRIIFVDSENFNLVSEKNEDS